MKYFFYLSIFAFILFGCIKEKDEDPIDNSDICADNYNPLTVGLATFGEVRHPLSSTIYFANSETSFYPGESYGLNSSSFSNFSMTIDGGDTMHFTPGYSSVIIDGMSAGTHTITMDLECTKQFVVNTENVYCECIDEELYVEQDIEFIEPTYIRVDSLIFNQSLPCDGINGALCPDVYFDWEYYNSIPNYVTGNYYQPEDGPIQLAYGDTIAIYPSECTIPIDIYDSDQFNNNDYLGNAVMNPTNMNGWTTGSHQIESNFWIVITRLN